MAFKWDVNLGHMLIAVPLIVGGTVYIVTDHNAVAALTTSYNDVKSDMQKGFDGIRSDIRALPSVQANMDQFKQNLEESKRTAQSLRDAFNVDHEAALKLSGKVDSLTERVNRITPIVDNLDQASRIPLGRKN
jgi:hypothetical protein